MTATTDRPSPQPSTPERRGFVSGLVHRQIDHYPRTGERYMYLALTVIATATLYYELYVTAAVNTLQLPDLHMSFKYYATLIAISYLAGAFGSVAAGVVDRYGRVNFLVGGLVVTGILTLWLIPACDSRTPFAILTCIVGFVEGICLVSTPALIRDYSPQVGRATAMGFWTMGPVLGSLIVSLVASATLTNSKPNPTNGLDLFYKATKWQHEYYICGTVGIIVAVVLFLFLKELSPRLRDQLMVSLHDRALIEAKAQGLDVEAATKNPWRQMIKPDIVISSLAISVFLVIYYTLVGTSVVYYQTAYKANADGSTRFPIDKANNLGNWQWLFLLLALLLIGALSDKLQVRKPMMVVGGIGAAIFMVVFLHTAGTAPSFTKIAVIVACLSFCLGLAYTPWMASFTETVEARNPALTPNGLAVWGWIVRVVITVTFLVLPQVVGTASTLVDSGSKVQYTVARYSNVKAFPATLSVGGKAVPLYKPSEAGTGLFGWAQAKANAPLIAFATKNAQTLGLYTQYAPEIATLQQVAKADPALAANLAKPGYTVTASDIGVLGKVAGAVAPVVNASLPAEKAAAAAARNAGLMIPVPPPASATGILTSLNTNKAAILKTVGALTPLLAEQPALVAQATASSLQLTGVTVASGQPDFKNLQAKAPSVLKAQAETPGQWKDWYWTCFGCIIFFLLTIPLMKGHWSPKKAKAEFAEHERMVDAEMAKLHIDE